MIYRFAYQVCDVSSNQNKKRFCSDDRTEISKKCIQSFFESLEYTASLCNGHTFVVKLFEDHCTKELKEFLIHIKNKYSSEKILIEVESIINGGITNSMTACFNYIKTNDSDLVYLIQDDYLFTKTSIYEVIDIYYQMLTDVKTDGIVSPFNEHRYFLDSYRNKPTPRTILCGKNRYWIQYYDMSCSFLCSQTTLIKNWDLIEKFLSMPPAGTDDGDLENVSLNYMLSKRGILGVVPIPSIALHMQSELEIDPYVDWKQLWNSIKI